ncbi:hypothetical protein GF352_04475 [archaeon]|nr:hypothetical protein [archaeon]
MWWGKSFVHNLEKEFRTEQMRDKRVFHDVNLRVNEPAELRVTCLEYLRSLGYVVDINEMSEFEESNEFNKFFRGGRLKPLKSIVKARKSSYLGSRFPHAWRLLFIVGLVAVIGYFLPFEELNKDLLFYTFTGSFILAGIFYLIKKVVTSSIWMKIIGVYDVEGVKADVRVVISADTSEGAPKVFDNLRDEAAELYDLISRKYIREPKKSMVKPATKSREEELVENITKVNNNIRTLRDKFINGRVSEATFNRLMSSLKKDKEKYETVFDLVTL